MTNARLNPDTFYVNGSPIPASYFQGIDTYQFQAINGNAGGTWSPTSGILIGGAGMWATGPWVFGNVSVLEVAPGSSLRVTHGDSDWVGLASGHAAASRALMTSLGPAADTSYWVPIMAPLTGSGFPSLPTTWTAGTAYTLSPVAYVIPSPANGFVYFVSSVSGSGTSGGSPPVWPEVVGATVTDNPGGNQIIWTCAAPVGTGQPRLTYASASHGATFKPAQVSAGGGRLTCPLRVHHGATVTQVVFHFLIGNSHSAGMPASLPQMRVLRLDMAGNAVPLCTTPTTFGWLGNGWLQFYGASIVIPSVYFNGGAVQTVTYACDGGTVIDTSRYAYVAQIIDESGAGAMGGNTFYAAEATSSAIPDLRPQ